MPYKVLKPFEYFLYTVSYYCYENMMKIRKYEKQDWPEIWQIIKPVFRAGETYAFSPKITEAEACKIWTQVPCATFVAANEHGNLIGTYYIKPNQPGLGAHVCNCGYIVCADARKQGIASTLCEHSQIEAVSRKFRAMQYNLVVATNKEAIRLWEKHGFEIVGTLPGAFRHCQLGFIDALIMYKQL